MPIRVTFYDGANCIGGNKFLLEADDTALLLDFGINFGAEALFFDEFLRPRSITGLCDLLDLGLLPPLRGIYRQDFELPERAWWERMRSRPLYRELQVHGVLLSHAHVDHSGYISFSRTEYSRLHRSFNSCRRKGHAGYRPRRVSAGNLLYNTEGD